MFSTTTTRPQNHRLKITAGTSYDPSTHQTITVNSPSPLHLENTHLSTNLWVRIKDYTGHPTTSPPTSRYFTHPPFTKNLYSLTFTFTPTTHPINGNNLLFGNDFDHPIRSYLPPGFNTALKIVKSTLDPSLEGDAYADKPYLYSPGLASWNQFSVGGFGEGGDGVWGADEDVIVTEGGVGDGVDVRKGYDMPESASSRRSYFLSEEKRKEFVFEEGRRYGVEFGNGFLDFNEFAIRIPGISFRIGKYVSEKNNVLRYVLKDRGTGEVYLVVCFTVVLDEDRKNGKDGDNEENAEEAKGGRDGNEVDGVD
ncbi:DUF1769-domain-containing protein [Aspergillus sclerotioniger CBS 115572]|uniref:DUF1769-domain-containing protein n=1 Tax=Aspergillus sclerotioniger CBS 115572 TaxID=1450535 RepID=A0A317V9X0_9EURO|nr:DUF1769-domain-containing protein [Aspergillus sclerotioniger CBS 115572]PWY70865.1 DUF1769-domain-containing protein [Aspergillus sclerotioniger CBS 115572]